MVTGASSSSAGEGNALPLLPEVSDRSDPWGLSQASVSTCSICGMEDENTFHALVLCPKALALRMAMRNIWVLPAKEVFRYTRYDWFIVLLRQLTPLMRDQIIFIFWRA
jgi:hypothetical protein